MSRMKWMCIEKPRDAESSALGSLSKYFKILNILNQIKPLESLIFSKRLFNTYNAFTPKVLEERRNA